MGYKLKRILIYPDGVTEKQVYPAGWTYDFRNKSVQEMQNFGWVFRNGTSQVKFDSDGIYENSNTWTGFQLSTTTALGKLLIGAKKVIITSKIKITNTQSSTNVLVNMRYGASEANLTSGLGMYVYNQKVSLPLMGLGEGYDLRSSLPPIGEYEVVSTYDLVNGKGDMVFGNLVSSGSQNLVSGYTNKLQYADVIRCTVQNGAKLKSINIITQF